MDYSLEWLVETKRDYICQNKISPLSPSDWNNDDDYPIYPTELILRAFSEQEYKSHEYSFMYDVEKLKENYIVFIRNNYDLNLPQEGIAISPNATSGIFLSLKTLRNYCQRVLIVTPTYFSVLDSVKHLKYEIIYFHLHAEGDYKINLENLKKMIFSQYIDLVIYTDPVFSVGNEMSHDETNDLLIFCEQAGVYLLCDYTLGGMTWDKETFTLEPVSKMALFQKSKKTVFIHSPTKRFFLNGSKFALIISSEKLIQQTERDSNFIIGGFTHTQLNLFNQFYSDSGSASLYGIYNENIDKILETHHILSNKLSDSKWYITNINSGYYCSVLNKERKIKEIDFKKFTKQMLFQQDTFLLPNSRFLFFRDNPFGFRVNLSKKVSDLLIPISRVIREDLEFYKL